MILSKSFVLTFLYFTLPRLVTSTDAILKIIMQKYYILYTSIYLLWTLIFGNKMHNYIKSNTEYCRWSH